MFKFTRDFVVSFLILSFLGSPCYAIQNYTYTTTISDNYNVEPAQGMTVNNVYYDGYNMMPAQTPIVYDGTNAYYAGNVNYNYANTPYNTVNTQVANPYQPYNREATITQSYEDTRENIDKNIDRAGKIVGVVGTAALIGAGITWLLSR